MNLSPPKLEPMSIGWICCVLIVLYFTFVVIVVSANSLGEFTIGGAANKLLALFLILIACSGWYGIFVYAPFTLVVQ